MKKIEKEEFLEGYWKQYLLLEEKTLDLEPYIFFSEKNLAVYSYEIMNLLFSVCSELDSFFKVVCNDKSDNIFEYIKSIKAKEIYNDIFEEKVDIVGKGFSITPFVHKRRIQWWKQYNLLKHNRLKCFKNANLKNLLNALAALYILEIYYYKNNFGTKGYNMPKETSKLFKTTKLIKKGGSISELEYEVVDEWEE